MLKQLVPPGWSEPKWDPSISNESDPGWELHTFGDSPSQLGAAGGGGGVGSPKGHLVGGEGGAHVPFACFQLHPLSGGTPRESKGNHSCRGFPERHVFPPAVGKKGHPCAALDSGRTPPPMEKKKSHHSPSPYRFEQTESDSSKDGLMCFWQIRFPFVRMEAHTGHQTQGMARPWGTASCRPWCGPGPGKQGVGPHLPID